MSNYISHLSSKKVSFSCLNLFNINFQTHVNVSAFSIILFVLYFQNGSLIIILICYLFALILNLISDDHPNYLILSLNYFNFIALKTTKEKLRLERTSVAWHTAMFKYLNTLDLKQMYDVSCWLYEIAISLPMRCQFNRRKHSVKGKMSFKRSSLS